MKVVHTAGGHNGVQGMYSVDRVVDRNSKQHAESDVGGRHGQVVIMKIVQAGGTGTGA